MKKRSSSLTIAILIVFFTSTVNASIFGEENVTLGAILTQSIEQVSHLSTAVYNIKKATKATSEVLSLSKQSYKQMQAAKGYFRSYRNVLNDLASGACQADPDLCDIIDDVKDIYIQAKALGKGDIDEFLEYKSKRDSDADKTAKSLMKAGYRTSYMSLLFPNEVGKADHKLAAANYIISQKKIMWETEQTMRNMKGRAALLGRLDGWLKETEDNKNLLLSAHGQSLVLQYATMQASQEMVEAKLREEAQKEQKDYKKLKDAHGKLKRRAILRALYLNKKIKKNPYEYYDEVFKNKKELKKYETYLKKKRQSGKNINFDSTME